MISRITRAEEFYALRTEWNDLLESSPSRNIFQTWEWSYVWWKHFGRGRDLNILVFRDQVGGMLGLAPLFIEKKPWRPWWKSLSFIGGAPSDAEFLDLIWDGPRYYQFFSALRSYFRHHRHAWDVVNFRSADAGSLSLGYMQEYLTRGHLRLKQEGEVGFPTVTLPRDILSLLYGMDAAQRKRLTDLRSRWSGARGVSFSGEPDRGELRSVVNRLTSIHARRLNGGKRARQRFVRRMAAFHNEVFREFQRQNWLDLKFMRMRGKSVAAAISFRYGDRLHPYLYGVSPRKDSEDVATMLFGRIVESAIESRLGSVEFLRGRERAKMVWANSLRKAVRWSLIRKRPFLGIHDSG